MLKLQKALLLLVGFSLLSCASLPPQLKTDVNYQRDVKMEIQRWDGKKWLDPLSITGIGIMPEASHYSIKVLPPGQADMITVTSCHREIKTPNPKKDSRWRDGYTFMLNMNDTIDDENNCSIDIGVYEKDKGRHAWGTIGFEDNKTYKLKALTKCNGRVWQYGGVSACQAKEGLIQQYEFDREVVVASGYGCEISHIDQPDRKKNKVWKFIMPPNECEIYFLDPWRPIESVHKAILFGYETIAIRGIE